MDITELNEAATFLYREARKDGWREGEEFGRVNSSVDHGLDKLDAIIDMCRLGHDTEDPDARRVLAALARKYLGRIPTFDAGAALGKARNALASEGFIADFNEAIRACDEAKNIIKNAKRKEN